jgi:hypothetical protein
MVAHDVNGFTLQLVDGSTRQPLTEVDDRGVVTAVAPQYNSWFLIQVSKRHRWPFDILAVVQIDGHSVTTTKTIKAEEEGTPHIFHGFPRAADSKEYSRFKFCPAPVTAADAEQAGASAGGTGQIVANFFRRVVSPCPGTPACLKCNRRKASARLEGHQQAGVAALGDDKKFFLAPTTSCSEGHAVRGKGLGINKGTKGHAEKGELICSLTLAYDTADTLRLRGCQLPTPPASTSNAGVVKKEDPGCEEGAVPAATAGAVKREREVEEPGSLGAGKKRAPESERWMCDLTADSDDDQKEEAVKWAALPKQSVSAVIE